MESGEQIRKSLSVSNRRLDELAWLLEGSSMCTAIAVIDGKFCISANEFSKRTQAREKNKKLKLICEIMEYFRLIATGKTNDSQKGPLREGLMKEIIKQQISTSTLGRISIPEEIFDEVITSQVLHKEELPREFKEKDVAYIALGYGIMVNKRIRKIESSIEDALKRKFGEINPEQLKAFQSFRYDDKDRKNSSILFSEEKPGVHAELQILSQILEMSEKVTSVSKSSSSAGQEFYIGISKRCCFNCENMLQAANEILKSRGIAVGYEGTHGAEFSENWICPSTFVSAREDSEKSSKKVKNIAAVSSSNIQQESIFEQVYGVYDQKITVPAESAEGSYTQRHYVSDSDYSSSPEERAKAYQDRLEGDLETLKRLDIVDEKTGGMLILGQDLCGILEFQQLFEEETVLGIKARGEEQVRVDVILSKLNKILSQSGKYPIAERDLVDFLSNKKFAPDKISECFAGLSRSMSSSIQHSASTTLKTNTFSQ